MVQLVTQQKKEMEEEFAKKAAGNGGGGGQRLEDKHRIQELEEEVASLRRRLDNQKQAASAAAAASSPPPPAPEFLPVAPPPPPPPMPTNRPIRVAQSASVGGGGSGGGPRCPKCERTFPSYDAFYGHEPCPGAGAGGGMLAGIGSVQLKKTEPRKPQPKAGVVDKKPGAFGNLGDMVASIAAARKQRSEQPMSRTSTHESLDRELNNARTSLRK